MPLHGITYYYRPGSVMGLKMSACPMCVMYGKNGGGIDNSIDILKW